MGQVEVMEKEGVVIGCDSRHLLEALWLEGNLGGRGCPVLSQPPGQHGLLKIGFKGFPSSKGKPIGSSDNRGGWPPWRRIVR